MPSRNARLDSQAQGVLIGNAWPKGFGPRTGQSALMWLVIPVLVSLTFVVSPANAATEDQEEGGHHGVVLRGLPVDGPFGDGTEFLAIDIKTMGFTILLFGLMYVVLNRYAWGPMLAALDDREMRIRQAIEDAKLARKEVERLGAETDVEIGRAHDEAKAVLDQARAEAGREVEQRLSEARARLAAQQQESLAAIEHARLQALADLRERSIDLAATMAGRVTNKRLNANEFRPLLEEVAN